MSDLELAEQLKYSNPNEIWIVGWDNHLIVLKCPFQILVLENIGYLKKGNIELVVEIKVTKELITVFIIKGEAYYYYYFDFII